MIFKEYKPSIPLKNYIVNYWIVSGEGTTPFEQKVIPDGYPELIFHFGDNYEIRLFDKWELQSKWLFSGQISNHFYLRNTGVIDMLGIKLQPWAPKQLFGLDVGGFTDKVISISNFTSAELDALKSIIANLSNTIVNPEILDQYFQHLIENNTRKDGHFIAIVSKIIESKGQIKIDELITNAGISRRSFERKFVNIIGLSPKYFSRIIRFNNIFKLIQEGDSSWCQVALHSGYYDQAHFIKEFKKFTGEKPSTYGLDDDSLANFFLKRN
ncbi:MAG: helix-turn-helix domain-containing protein [Fulvivirga sp.]|uniref:DUF6597 domain-containing transcriptional factor n=1 Tax=Fulvivirga sp. TaxID=1931237 RepID=UPI0032EEB7D8